MIKLQTTKEKGNELEEYVSEQIRAKQIDLRARPSPNSGGTNGIKSDINTSMMILGQNAGIECKNQASLLVAEWWRQCKKLQSLGMEPILVFKLLGEPLGEARCVVYLDTLLEIIKLANRIQEDK